MPRVQQDVRKAISCLFYNAFRKVDTIASTPILQSLTLSIDWVSLSSHDAQIRLGMVPASFQIRGYTRNHEAAGFLLLVHLGYSAVALVKRQDGSQRCK